MAKDLEFHSAQFQHGGNCRIFSTERKKKAANGLRRQLGLKAEGTRVELATGCPATDFESVR